MDLAPRWWNLGGQIMSDTDLKQIIKEIKNGTIDGWDDLHRRYDEVWEDYCANQKLAHALSSLERLEGTLIADITDKKWNDHFKKAYSIQVKINELTKISRKKDYTNPFRKMMYENEEEMKAVLGSFEDNSFIAHLESETIVLAEKLARLGINV